jgi:hypothetical protein
MNWEDIITPLLLIILGIIGIIIISTNSFKEKDINAKCYDNYGNEINGVTCTEFRWSSSNFVILEMSPLLLIVGVIMFIWAIGSGVRA